MDQNHDATLLERLIFFSDAVFAIAITLLVIEIHPPEIEHADATTLVDALVALTPEYIGFLVSFMVVGRFWLGHHRMFGMVRVCDDRLVIANLAVLFGIAFMPFTTAVYSDYPALVPAILLYTGWLTLIGILNAVLVRMALRPQRLMPDHDAALAKRLKRGSWLPILIGVGGGVLGSLIAPIWALVVLVVGPVISSLVLSRR